jgi:hypothetical protein
MVGRLLTRRGPVGRLDPTPGRPPGRLIRRPTGLAGPRRGSRHSWRWPSAAERSCGPVGRLSRGLWRWIGPTFPFLRSSGGGSSPSLHRGSACRSGLDRRQELAGRVREASGRASAHITAPRAAPSRPERKREVDARGLMLCAHPRSRGSPVLTCGGQALPTWRPPRSHDAHRSTASARHAAGGRRSRGEPGTLLRDPPGGVRGDLHWLLPTGELAASLPRSTRGRSGLPSPTP